ncbi:MAG: hypothetical protein AAF291_06500 [Pseudomonadota bacterium]
MSETLAQLDAFFVQWREALEARALVRFEAGALPQEGLTPAVKADAFSSRLGCKPIGFNWEMLDPSDDLAAPRSARATMVEALTNDMIQTKTPWLGAQRSLECAQALFAPFDQGALSVVTNHLNGLWYPISGASDEWTFVAMDDETIALLILVPRG